MIRESQDYDEGVFERRRRAVAEAIDETIDVLAERQASPPTCLAIGSAAGVDVALKLVEAAPASEIALPVFVAASFAGLGAAALRRRNQEV